MNAPVLLAQLSGSSPQASGSPNTSPKNMKLEKPQGGQAVSVHLDGNTRLDFSDIASEKLTFVRVGEKLIVLFDNQSTVTVDPVFDSNGHPLANVAFEMTPDRTLSGDEFAALFPITTDQSVLPAAGPGGNGPTAGAHFGDPTVDALPSFTPLDLLGGENTGSTFNSLNDQVPNPTPIPGVVDVANVDEDGLAGGNPDNPGAARGPVTVTGSLHVNFGTDAIGRSFSFAADQSGLANLTSDGQAIHLFVTTTAGGQPQMIGYVGSDPSIAANQVFTISLDATSTIDGTYTFTLLRPMDHPILGAEDTLNLTVNVTATDGSGDHVNTVIHVNVTDDVPIIVAADETHSTLTDPLAGTVATQTGSLGISWGADSFNDHVDGGVSATTGKDGDRAVVFSDAIVTATGDAAGVATSIATLTSAGQVVHFALLDNGTELIAYTGETAPTSFPTDAATAASEHIVFTVSLSDASSTGSYVISQYQPLDHNGGTTLFDSIDLSFHFTATDSDGDPVSGTLSATITDTAPAVTESSVTHSTLTDPLNFTHATATGTLGIAWGADSFNAHVDGGVSAVDGQDGDRAVIFSNPTVTATGNTANGDHGSVATAITGLTSEGQVVHYVLLDNGTTLVACTGDNAPTTVPSSDGGESKVAANIVFVVALSDASDTGGYTVTQYQPLDHVSDGAKFDSIDLTFNFTAIDSDGDAATGTLTVTVDDTVPVIAGAVDSQTVGEDGLPSGNQIQGDVQALTVTASLDVNWGADNEIVTAGNGFGRTLAFLAGDDSTAIAGSSATVSSLALSISGEQGIALSSGGVALVYVVTTDSNGGETLTAYKGSASGAVIFTLSLDPTSGNGSYTFDLQGPLDHGAASNSIALTFAVQATDADGDAVQQSFTVNVQDDVPVVTGAIATQTVGEEGLADANHHLPNEAQNASTGHVSLNIAWGADTSNPTSGGGSHDRSVAFASTTISALNALHLTSDGQALTYTVTSDSTGALLTATAGTGNGAHAVFTVQLSDGDNGSYDFTLLANLDHASGQGANDQALTFNVVATDSDGDTVGQSFTVNVQDDVPVAGTGTPTTVDEGDLPGGNDNHDGGYGYGHGSPTPSVTGDLHIKWGADDHDSGVVANRSVAFTSTTASSDVHVTDGGGNPVAGLTADGLTVKYAFDGGTLVGYTGSDLAHGTRVFEVSLNDDGDGSYTLTLLGNLDHPPGNGENNLNLTFNFTATDFDGDTSSNTFIVTVNDDVPIAHTGDSGFIDEGNASGGNDNHGHDGFGPQFPSVTGDLNIYWGADNALSARSVSFTNASVAVTDDNHHTISGLTADGVPVLYTFIGNVLVGYTGATPLTATAGNVVFNVTLSHSGDGSYTFTLLGNIDHPQGSGENDLNFTFNYTATDSDGDSASNTFTVTVKDDVPVAHAGGSRSVDEDDLSTGSSPHSSDLTVTGDLNIAWGADSANPTSGGGRGDRSVAFSSSIASHNVEAEDSHGHDLTLTSGGQTIHYAFDSHGTLVGYTGASLGSGTRILEVSLSDRDDGSYTFKLLGAIDHPAGNGENTVSLNFDYTATDSDGDTSSNSFTVSVKDDVPVTPPGATLTLNEAGLDTNGDGVVDHSVTASVDANGAAGLNPGADGFFGGSLASAIHFTTLPSGLTMPDGTAIDITTSGATVTGTRHGTNITVFTLTVSADGTYTFEQDQPLHHPSAGADTDSFNFGFTIKDGDGDVSSAATITVKVTDAVPTTPADATLSVNEAGLDTNGDGVIDHTVTAALDANGSAVLDPGADGFFGGSLASAIHFTTLPTGLTTADGTAIDITTSGTTVTGTKHGTNITVFTLSVSADGTYTFVQDQPLHHPSAGADVDSLDFGFTIKDGDGDVSGAASITVDITDAVPTAPAGATMAIDEHGLVGAADISVVSHNAALAPGADGFAGGSLATAIHFTTLPTGLTVDNGTAVTVTQNGATVTGMAGSTIVFTLTIAADGTYTYDQKVALHHGSTGADVDTLNFAFTITDGDGDVSASAAVVVNVTDDVPTIALSGAIIVEDETPGIQPGTNDVALTSAPALPPAGFLSLAQSAAGYAAIGGGADGVKSVALTDSHGAKLSGVDSGLTTLDGTHILLTTDATNPDLVRGMAGGTLALALYVDPVTGTVSVAEYEAIEHPLTSNPNDAVSLANVVYVSVTDGDGDVATSSTALQVSILDDGPTIGTPAPTTAQESDLTSHPSSTTHGSLGVTFGTDGPAAAAVAANPGTPTTLDFNSLVNGGGAPYHLGNFTIQTDQGVANTTGHQGEVYGSLITVTDSAGPFTLTSVNLGLFGQSTGTAADNVTLLGFDALGNQLASVTVNLGATIGLGSNLSYLFSAAGTAFDGLSISKLEIEPVLSRNPDGSIFNGSVIIDNLAVNSGSAPAVPGAVYFTDQSSAIANVHSVDDQNHFVDLTQLTSHGQAVHFALIDAMTLVGYTGSTAPTTITDSSVVFSVVLSQNAGNPDGAYDFTLLKPLDDLPASVSDLKLSFDFTAKDGDGDTTAGHFVVDVHDDAPTLTAAQITDSVDEGGLNVTFNLPVQLPPSVGNDPGAAVVATGSLASLVHFGADGPSMTGNATHGFQFVAQDSADATSFVTGLHLTSLGSAVDQATLSGNTLTATADDGHNVFTLALNGDGSWTFTLLAPLDDAHSGEDATTIDFSSQVRVVDFDGDTVTLAPGSFNISVTDDVPVATAAADAVNVSEHGLTGSPVTQAATGFLNIQWGADDGASKHLAFVADGNGHYGPALTSGGVALDYIVTTVNNAGVISPELVAYKHGGDPGDPVFTVTLYAPNGEGAPTYSFVLFHPLDESGAGADTVALHFNVSATDSDGDSVQQMLTVNVTDDVPVAHADTNSLQSGATVAGNVEGNDVAGADGIASITWANATNGTVAGTYGTLTVHADGSYSYTAKPNVSGVDTFNYTLTDGDGDTSATTLSITVANGQPHPVAASGTVDEAALDTVTDAGDVGHGTVTGSNPTLTTETTSGQLTLRDPDTPHITSIAGVTSATIGGSAVTVDGSYGVLQIDQNGAYTYTLTKPYTTTPAANNGAETEPGKDVFTYTVTDSLGNTQTSTISISIKDDVPTAHADSASVAEGARATNVVLMIDTSGSVAGSSLAEEKAAAINLLNAGINGGQVLVVDFNDSTHNSGWVSVAAAISYINNLSAGGDTNYDAALQGVETFFAQNATPAAAQTVAYFLSDGAPNAPDHSVGISPSEQAAWDTFLSGHGISTVFGVKVGSSNPDSDIAPIAYPGNGDNIGIDGNANGLVGTLPSVPNAVTGNILTNDGFGADGRGNVGGLLSIAIDGVTYTFNGTNITYTSGGSHTILGSTLDVHTALGGELTLYFTDGGGHHAGDFSYNAPTSVSSNQTETFHYTIVDGDGDQSAADLVVTVDNVPHAPTGLDLSAGDDSFSSANPAGTSSDNITNHTSGLTISGSAENGTTVTLFDDANGDGKLDNGETVLKAGIAVTNGAFTADIALTGPDATHNIVAFETDSSGNTSPGSSPLQITIDTTAPAASVTGFVNDTGVVGDHITSDNRLTITGTAEANSRVTVFQNGVSIGTTTADGNGNWSEDDNNTLQDGHTYQFTAQATDLAGNTGSVSSSYAAIIDRTDPTVTVQIADGSLNIADNSSVVTFTFSEAPVGFSLSDIQVSNGTLSGFTGSGTSYQAIFTAKAGFDGNGSVSVSDNSFTDAAGNGGQGDSDSVSIDTIAPTTTIAITDIVHDSGVSSSDFITNDNKLTVEGTYNNLSGNTIQVSTDGGATWSNVTSAFAGSWSYTDPATHSDGNFTYQVRVVDDAGNVGNTTSHAVTIDTTAPTVAVDITDTSLSDGHASSNVTFTFSEAPVGFTSGDISLANGTISNFKAIDATHYSATFTATDGVAGSGSVTVGTGYTDTAGNTGVSGSDSVTIDTKNPTVTSIVMGDTSLLAGETSTVTITFSEAVTGFTSADVTAPNGTLSGLTSSNGGVTWTGTFTPTADVHDTSNVLTVQSSSYTDLAGNPGAGGSSSNYVVDTIPPPVFSSPNTALVNEGVAAHSMVYIAAATNADGEAMTYSLSGTDAAAFTINASTGVVTINTAPDFETKSSYSFTVQATETTGESSTEAVTLNVSDLAPVISSPASATVNEGVAAHSSVYTAVAADPAGGAVTYSLSGADAALFTINSSNGAVSINNTPDFETKASYDFTVKASDASGLFNTEAVTLSVTDLAPVISSPAAASVNEGVAVGSTVYTAVAADPGGGVVTYSLSGTDAAAFTINASTGAVTINNSPDFETKASYNFTVNASDASGLLNTEAVTVGVNDLPPVISSPATASVNEGVAGGATVYTAVAADPAGGTVTYSLSGADASAFTINASTGAVTIKASPDFETKSSYSFNVVASDASAHSNSEAVTLTVNDLAPVISSSATASVNEGVAGGSAVYTAVAADPGGGTVTYSLTGTDASAFTINASTGVVAIKASPDFETKSSYSFNVVASDPSAHSNAEAVTLTVNDLAPAISSAATAAVNEGAAGGSTVYTAIAADPAGGTVTYSLSGADASAFTINASTGAVTINNSPDFETKSSYNFTVNASDASGLFNTEAVTVNIADVAPTNTVPSAQTVVAGASLVFNAAYGDLISVSDPNGATLTETLTVSHGALTLSGETGLSGVSGEGTGTLTFHGSQSAIDAALSGLTYVAASNFSGSDTLSISSSDGTLSTPSSVAITVQAGNHPPVVQSFSNGSVTEDASNVVQPNLLTNGGFNGGNVSGWTFASGSGGFSQFGGAALAHSGSNEWIITTFGSNPTPATLSQSVATTPGSVYTLQFWVENYGTATQFLNDSFRVSWNGVTIPGSSLTNVPPAGNSSNQDPSHYTEYTFQVTGAAGASSTALSFSAVDTQNNAWLLDDVSVTAGAPLTPGTETTKGTIAFTDAEVADTHTVSFAAESGGYVGTFTPVVSTDSLNNTTGTVTWTYTVADSALQHLAAGQTVQQFYDVTISDSANPHGTVVQRVEVDLVGTNDAPTAVADTAGVTEGATLTVNARAGGVLGNDTDPDTTDVLTVSAVRTGTSGTLQTVTSGGATTVHGTWGDLHINADGTYTYTPSDASAAGEHNTDVFTYTAQDPSGATSTATLSITVNGVNDAPVVQSFQSGTVTEGDALGPTVGSNLIANGGFESQGLPGWSVTGNGSNFSITPAHSGGLAQGFGQGTDTLSQTFATVADGLYTVDFFLANAAGSSDSFTASWNGVTLGTPIVNAGPSGYTEYTYTVFGDAGSSQLSFALQHGGFLGSGNFYWMLDDVSVTQVAGVEGATGTVTFTDADLSDTHTVTATADHGGYIGTFTPTVTTDSSGGQTGTVTWTYTVDDATLAATVAPQTSKTQSYTIAISDGHGGITDQDVSVTLTNPDHAPLIQAAGTTATGSVTAGLSAGIPSGNLLTNGGFETGSFSGWLQTGNTGLNGIQTGGGFTVHGGNDAADFYYGLGSSGSSTLSQSFATVAGVEYTLTYFLSSVNNQALPDSFSVSMGGTTLDSLTNYSSDPVNGFVNYQEFTFDVVATSSNTTLTFSFGDGGSGHWLFDDVSVQTTPGVESTFGQVNFTDVDATDTHTVSVANNSNIGTFTASIGTDSTGGHTGVVDWSYSVNDSDLAGLTAHDHLTETYTVLISDGRGGTVSENVVVTVNGPPPAVTSVALTSNPGTDHTYVAGNVVAVTVNFNAAMSVTGTPQLLLNIGGVNHLANYVSGSGTDALVFDYTVAPGDNDTNGISIGANALSLNGGTIKDAFGDNANLATPAVTDNSNQLVDTTPPAETISSTITTNTGATTTISSGGATKDNTLALSGTVSDNGSGVASVQIFDGSTSLGFATVTGGNWSFTTSALADGSHSFTAKATDNVGNTTTTSAVTATVDTVAPAESISSTIATTTGAATTISSGGLTKDNTLGLSGTVSDTNGSGVASVQIFDGTTSLGFATVTGSSWSFTTSALVDGSHSLTAKATDNAGNTTTTSAVTATVDTTAPAETISSTITTNTGLTTTITSGGVTKDNTLGLSGTVSDTGGGVASVQIFDGTTSLGFATVTGNSWSFTTGQLSDAAHSFTAKATDNAGNTTTTSAVTATVDTTAPTVTFSSDTLHNSSADSFSGKISDNASGPVTIQLFSGNSPGTIVGGASTSVSVTGGAAAANWSISASTSLSAGGHAYVQATDAAGNVSISSSRTLPAGVAGSPINLALTDYADHSGLVSVTIAGLAAGWVLNDGVHNSDGTWTVQTSDVASLSVTPPEGYAGALVLQVTEAWTNADGSVGHAFVPDNVEAYAKGAPIFAWSGDDNLTASSGNDTLVFANRIGTDVVHNFDTAHDQIDLIGFAGMSSFADVQAHLANDAAGNARITLGDGETITLVGVDAGSLNAGDFVFDQTAVTHNAGTMAVSDGALLPISGTVANSGVIELNSAGNETDLELVQHGVTLQGGGVMVLTDNSENVIFGSEADVTLTNVDNTISGAGQLGDGQMTLVNEGSIIATGSNALVIDTGDNTVANTGTLEATGSGGLVVHSNLANDGVVWANGGDVTLDGDVSGGGSARISQGGHLDIGGAFNERIVFDDGAAGTLTLDHPADFSGILSGFGGNDVIDLAGILGASATLNFTENAQGTGGILSVTDGSHSANIAFAGQYASADFHIAADQGYAGNHALIQLEHQAQQLTNAA
jgi:T1SS-143 domain-containing protein